MFVLSNLQLSPHQVLESRSRFREAPPQNLPQVKFQDIDGLHGVLVTLYHLLKLLSSHGIKSTCEMLEEKLQTNKWVCFYNSIPPNNIPPQCVSCIMWHYSINQLHPRYYHIRVMQLFSPVLYNFYLFFLKISCPFS